MMNLFGLVLFRGGGEMHGHSHGDNGHSHGHSHGGDHGHSHSTGDVVEEGHSHGHSHDDTNQNTSNQAWLKIWSDYFQLQKRFALNFRETLKHEIIKSDPLSLNILKLTVRFISISSRETNCIH